MCGEISISNSSYPKLLKNIKNPPQKIYYRGRWDDSIFENTIGIVGSRKMTLYGKRVVHNFVPELSQAGISIVSGFMYGIDGESHVAALESGGKTIAVMPCGADVIHPTSHQYLYNRILENEGLILSEFAWGITPKEWTFSRRNRIIAGLSKSVFVIESSLESGSLITANYAREFERKIFTVAADIFSNAYKGNYHLLKLGADMCTSSSDVLAFYGINKPENPSNVNNSLSTNSIFNLLKSQSMSVQELVTYSQIPLPEITRTLTQLQMEGVVLEQGGVYYVN